jgi:hypothetical protein
MHCVLLALLLLCVLQEIALRTPGFAGADLANLLNEAAILAGRKSLPGIRLQEIDEAVDRWELVQMLSHLVAICDDNALGHFACQVACNTWFLLLTLSLCRCFGIQHVSRLLKHGWPHTQLVIPCATAMKHTCASLLLHFACRIVAGMEGKPLTDGKAKSLVAYHEVGHAVCGTLTAGHDPVQKVTLIPRGQARGLTWFIPGEDPTLISKQQIFARIVGALGGRAAEEVIFGDAEVTSGASGDLQQVRMV